MKEKIKSVWQKVKDFVKVHWIDILVAIISALLGAVIESWLDNHKTKTYTYGESFDRPESIDDIVIDNLAGWKIRLDTVGNKVVSAGLQTSWFYEDDQNKCISNHTICSNSALISIEDYLDFDYDKHNV